MRTETPPLRRLAGMGALVLATALGACATITPQQEVQLGLQQAREINQQLPIVSDAALEQYINSLGDQLVRQARRQFDYTFYIVNTDAVNAFALPGGFVYVNRGLIEQTENLSELAGVLAHEIAHVEERHGAEQLERAQTANLVVAIPYFLTGRTPTGLERAAVGIAGTAYLTRHSREAEREADRVAVSLLVGAGISPQGLITFFQKLLSERQRRPSQLEQWFSTHPLTEERIRDVQSVLNTVPPAQLRNLTTTSAAYRDFKARMQRYPQPPAEFRTGR